MMDYQRRFAELKSLIEQNQPEQLGDFLTLQSRLLENLDSERRFGVNETIRSERARILHELDNLFLSCFGHPFQIIESSLAVSSTFQIEKYLERLQSHILNAFRQDHYVMLTVEPLESEDSDTLIALQQALRSAFDIQVKEDGIRGGRQQPLEEAITPHPLVALLGDPGIGKTTSLRFIALRQIEHIRTGTSQLVPVWVSLGKWADKEMSAEEFLWREFLELFDSEQVSRDTFQSWLAQGRFLFLLDGLNELPQRELEKRGASLSQPGLKDDETEKRSFDPRENSLLILARESQSHFFLSCRILEYTHLPDWREFRILPLNDEQIADFVQRHLGHQSQRLETMLEQQPGLRELIRSPFFLRSLVRLVQENWQVVPTDRFQVVQFTCQAGLHREAQRRGLNAEQEANLLGKASLDSMGDGWIGSWFNVLLKLETETDEDRPPQALAIVDAMRCAEGAGLVVRTEEDAEQVAYRYLHQLVQEALALIYLKSEHFKDADYPEVRSLARIGEVHLDWGKFKEAQENFLRALELCPTVGAETVRASILLNLSKVYRLWRQSREGLKYAEAAVQLLDSAGDTAQLAETYHELGVLNRRLKRPREAERYYRLSLEVYERLGDRSKYAYEILYGLADLYSDPMVYRIPYAMSWYQKVLDIFEAQGDVLGVARTKLEMALAWRLWGEIGKAGELFSSCVAESERLRELWLQIMALSFWGYALRDTRRLSEASSILEKALHLAQQTRSQWHQFYTLVYGLAWVASYQGKHRRALELLDEALDLAKRQADPSFMADVYGDGLGYIYWRAEDFWRGAKYWLLSDKIMDEEGRLHLTPLRRLSIKWAETIGIHTDTHRLARLVSEFLWAIFSLLDRLSNPSHWLGRQLYRFVWWLHRF